MLFRSIGGVDNPGMGGSSVFGSSSTPKLNLAKVPSVSKANKDTRNLFSGMSAGKANNKNGRISIDLTLSPDLEARVVKNTMDKTADVMTKIRRSK